MKKISFSFCIALGLHYLCGRKRLDSALRDPLAKEFTFYSHNPLYHNNEKEPTTNAARGTDAGELRKQEARDEI